MGCEKESGFLDGGGVGGGRMSISFSLHRRQSELFFIYIEIHTQKWILNKIASVCLLWLNMLKKLQMKIETRKFVGLSIVISDVFFA